MSSERFAWCILAPGAEPCGEGFSRGGEECNRGCGTAAIESRIVSCPAAQEPV